MKRKIAMHAPELKFKNSKAVLYMYSATTFVELKGPPPVIIRIILIRLKVPILNIMVSIRRIGVIKGKVIFINICQPDAPSILALSYKG